MTLNLTRRNSPSILCIENEVLLVTVSEVEKHAAGCQIHLVINKLATDIGPNLCLDLLSQNILENNSVCSKL